MIAAAMTEQDFGRGWAIAMGVLLLLLLLGWLMTQWTKPRRRRGRRY